MNFFLHLHQTPQHLNTSKAESKTDQKYRVMMPTIPISNCFVYAVSL
jgi:hypothetical protein